MLAPFLNLKRGLSFVENSINCHGKVMEFYYQISVGTLYRPFCVFALSSDCRDDNEIVPQVLTAVLQLPDTTHVALRYTSILLVGGLSDWIEKHPDVLGEFLYFLITFTYMCVVLPVQAPGTSPSPRYQSKPQS